MEHRGDNSGASFRKLNRRSQRRSDNWTGFNELWQSLRMPRPRAVEKALHSSRIDPMLPVTLPFALCIARLVEEPGTVVPHAGICEGAARQRAVLP